MKKQTIKKVVIFIILAVFFSGFSSYIIQMYEPDFSTNLALDTVKENPEAWQSMRAYQTLTYTIYSLNFIFGSIIFIILFGTDIFLFTNNYLKKVYSKPKTK